MKRILSLLFLLSCWVTVTAQDIIVKTDKTEIKAKVLEVAEDVIKYKQWEFQDGPTYNVRKAEVFMIIYKNGKRETFTNAPAPAVTPRQQNNTVPQPTPRTATTVPQQPQSVKNQSEATKPTESKENKTRLASLNSSNLLSDLKLTGGITFGDMTFTTSSGGSPEFSPLIGYMLGVAKEYSLTENISIQPGVALVGWGAQYASSDNTYYIHYLSLEGIARYKTPFALYAGAGAYFDFGLFGTQGYPSGETVSPFDNNGLSRLNLGLTFEAGYPLTIAGKNTEVFSSYRYGLNNVEGEDAPSGQTAKFQMFTVGLRYFL